MPRSWWIWCIFCAVLVTIPVLSATAAGWEENPKIGELFKSADINGTFVLYDVAANRYIGRDKARAERRQDLPFPPAFQKSVCEIVLLDQGENWRLYGKTGWQNAPGPGVGWWVGWVQKDGHVYAFALNLDIHRASDASKRVELGKASLKALGIL